MRSEHRKSISSQYSRNQKRTAGQIVGLELQSSFIFKSQSAFKGSFDAQPLGLNSTVDPSWCRHLKQKFLGSATSRLLALIAFEGNKTLARCALPSHPFLRVRSTSLGLIRYAFSGFNSSIERFQSFADFLDLMPDQFDAFVLLG
jgi:hypothetical protein